jgi:ABC-type transporter Mla maintaining outer membrane lipid asymmetry ATPase subunit MlaF
MEGLSDSIISLVKNNSVSFTNLDPGTYTFKVWTLNDNGVWNKNYSYLTLIISPPFWKTWWFYSLCALLFAGIIYSIYNYRLQQILKLQHIRNKIASDLHDDIGSTLSSIAIYSELANEEVKDKAPKAFSLLQTINESARTTIDSMSDIVWAINPKNDRFEKILIRMRAFASEILEARNIDLRFEAASFLSGLKLPMDKRKNLYLIFKEAVNNVAKYSESRNCTIRLWQEGKMLNMEIADDGHGFDMNDHSEGNGLLNMKKRGEEMVSTLGLKNETKKLVGELPLGWKQKLAFSVAIFHRPKIVFLDEPTGGVDPITRRQFWDLIYEAAATGITVFVTTHYMDEAEYCKRISVMVDGRIEALDTPANLKREYNTHSMDEVFYQLARRAQRTAD